MNSTPPAMTPERALDQLHGFTIANLVLIALLAFVVIAAIVYGARLRAQRRAAETQEVTRLKDAEERSDPVAVPAARGGVAEPDALASPAPEPASGGASGSTGARVHEPVVMPPTSPAPPPLGGIDEPVPAAAAFDASPAAIAADALANATPLAASGSDDADAPVTTLKGLGPKVAARLGELGITRVGQLAALSEGDAQALDDQLGSFKGRMGRDRWIEQARLLAAGDRRGYEDTFGKL